jgi:hypothetical protein
MVGTINYLTPVNIFSADLFIRYTANGNTYEHAFRDREIAEFLQPSSKNDALLGMDILRLGILVTNGQTMTATFCW